MPRTAGIAWHASGKDNAFQFKSLAKFLTDPVKTLANTQAAESRVHRDIHAVQNVSFRIMPCSISATSDLHPCMGTKSVDRGDPESGAMPDNLSFIFGNELAVRKPVDLGHQMVTGIFVALSIYPG